MHKASVCDYGAWLQSQRLCSRLTALWRYINCVLLFLLLLYHGACLTNSTRSSTFYYRAPFSIQQRLHSARHNLLCVPHHPPTQHVWPPQVFATASRTASNNLQRQTPSGIRMSLKLFSGVCKKRSCLHGTSTTNALESFLMMHHSIIIMIS